MNECCSAVEDPFVVPDSENVKNLGPGCFVRVRHQSDNIWVEITAEEDGELRGVLHPELSGETVASLAADQVAVRLQIRQINALGCGRYCYCD